MSEKRKEVRYIAQKFANAILADASPYVISTDGLQALNAFLDELLFILIDTAKGLETSRIKAAVYQTFPTALGKNAIVEAELEAKSYIDMGGKDTSNHMGSSGQSGTSSIFNADSDETRVEQVFEQFRAKCQYYSKLGERLGSPAGNPNNTMNVPTLIAIYVTAVLEHVAEYVLQVASTIADRQDHADMVTVREVYVALLEDRQIENIFETMILKSQLQKRFRNSLIMPGTGSRPEEQTPATVKRSGSWGKQLRLGNADKPKLDVQLPTDFEEDDILFDPNRPQFGDWDTPPDEENKIKKKNDFEMLFSSGETMKVSLTPNRLRTIEVHRKAGAMGGAVAARSSSRAASVLNGREGKSHGRKPSQGTQAAAANGQNGSATGSRKNSHASAAHDPQTPPPPPYIPTTPNVPVIPANLGVSQPILRKQGQSSTGTVEAPLSPAQQQQHLKQQSQPQQHQQSWSQPPEYQGLGIAEDGAARRPSNNASRQQDKMERVSTSTFGSELTLSTAGASSMAPLSPSSSRSPVSPITGARNADGALKTTLQATNELGQFFGNSSLMGSYSEQPPAQNELPMTPSLESSGSGVNSTGGKKENPIKSFMGRLGRNSMIQRTSIDSSNSNAVSSPTSIRSFTITGGVVGQQPQSGSGSGSASGSTNGSVYSSNSTVSSTLATSTASAATTAPYHLERRGSGQNVHDTLQLQQSQLSSPMPTRVLSQDSRSNFAAASGFPLPPDNSSSSPSNGGRGAMNGNNNASINKNMVVPPPLNTAAASGNPNHRSQSPVQHPHPVSPEGMNNGGIPIPSRNASLNHDVSSPTKASFSGSIGSHGGSNNNSYDTRTGLEAGLPRPLSPRSSSPRPSSPRAHSPLQSPQHFHRNNPLEVQAPIPGSIHSPSPLSNSITGTGSGSGSPGHNSTNVSPSGSSTSLIMYGKVQHIQERLSKTIQPPLHGFKPHDHLQNHPNRISLEGTIRANPFYQQDRNSSVRSSLADLSSSAGSATNSAEIQNATKVGAGGRASSSSPVLVDSDVDPTSSTPPPMQRSAGVNSSHVVSSESDSDIEGRQDKKLSKNRSVDGMISPATSPEMGSALSGSSSTLKDNRLPSATTRTLTAAAVAAKQQQLQQKQHFQQQQQMHQQEMTMSPISETNQRFPITAPATSSLEQQNPVLPSKRASDSTIGSASREQQADAEEPEEEEDEDEEDVPYVAPVPRNAPGNNRHSIAHRHSIFVDETAQAMDALSRARHRQSMRLEDGEAHDEDEDDDDYDISHGIQPPEKWHYSDLEDEDDYDDDDDEDDEEIDEYTQNGERRRRKHESFMSAKSVLMPNGSTVSLVDQAHNDTQDEDEDEIDFENEHKQQQAKEQLVRSLEVQQQQEHGRGAMFASHQNLTADDFIKGHEYVDLIPTASAGSQGDDESDDDQNGADYEDESEDSEDLEDNDDEEGQDRRIYLQQLRTQQREARRLERLAAGEAAGDWRRKGSGSRKGKNAVGSSSTAAAPAFSSAADGATGVARRRTLKKGQSKENLRSQQDRPQTPTTPVPTTQVIPLTPTDLVLIRQKLFAAGNFEASMRMLDTIFHAAMAKMVEGRERGVQTEPVSFLQDEDESLASTATATPSIVPSGMTAVGAKEVKTTFTSTSTSTTLTDAATSSTQPQKQLQWVTMPVVARAAPIVEDDDDEDRVVEWLLGGV
ncbi:hypothetical protein EDD11_006379 [Mortierella claussenii]|nr:hypothetical protein EDD11_006379 [Mortierella claussenii]